MAACRNLRKDSIMKKLTAISLFAGVGGICLGFKNNGVDIIYANDFDKYACETYRTNFNHTLVEGDMTKIKSDDMPQADILLGGSPCQAFSIAGYRKGFNDERGNLFFEYLRILVDKQPQAFLFENVKNLTAHDGGKTFAIMLDAFKQNGYHVRYQVLNSCDYGNVPQNRERIYVVGFKDEKKFKKFYFPHSIPLSTKISDIIDKTKRQPDKYYYNDKKCYETMLKDTITKEDTIYQLRRVYVRENKSNLCPTLTANMGTGGHNVPLIKDKFGIRKLTPRECFLFQGFPKDYKLPENMSDCHLYKQAGNSVSVPVIERIAKNIVFVLNDIPLDTDDFKLTA